VPQDGLTQIRKPPPANEPPTCVYDQLATRHLSVRRKPCHRRKHDFGYAYVERQNTKTYMVQSYGPLEEMELEFNEAIERLIEVANQNIPKSS
jgi:hypothetical protein